MIDNKDLLDELEAKVDHAYEATIIPHDITDIAVWHLFTMSEDFMRMHYNKTIKSSLLDVDFFVHTNPYAVKNSMDLIIKKTKPISISLSRKTIPDSYEKSSVLYQSAKKFNSTSRLIASAYNGCSTVEKNDGIYIIKYSDSIDPRYGALEALDHGRDDEPDITGVLYQVLNGNEHTDWLFEEFNKHCYLSKGNVKYAYNTTIVQYLVSLMPQRTLIIPNAFVFPWGGVVENQSLINSLLIRCLYHTLAIEFIARKRRIKGGAESSLVLLTTSNQLREDLKVLANFDDDKVNAFIEHMTYGYSTKNPDPALQPLYKTKKLDLLIPCYLILNSNIQRNILSLSSRINVRDFNSQSHLFEKAMIEELSPHLLKFKRAFYNKTITVNKQTEEIDVLLIDMDCKLILAMELRWMIQPGDAREINERVKACNGKVSQLSRKLDFLRHNIKEMLDMLYTDVNVINSADWRVEGIVLIQGFGGSLSSNDRIPLITMDVFISCINLFTSIDDIYSWISSLEWLPKDNLHFSVKDEEITLDDAIISRPGLIINVSSGDYVKSCKNSVRLFIQGVGSNSEAYSDDR
jgi:hypothetical protein